MSKSPEQIPDWLANLRSLPDQLEHIPADQQLAYIRATVELLPEDKRELASHFVTAVISAAKSGAVPMPKQRIERFERLLAPICGIAFMITMIVLAVKYPNPTPYQYQTFRIILAVAVAGFAATIPGFLEVKISSWIKASGALAVFVLVFFYNPAGLVVEQLPQDIKSSRDVGTSKSP